MLPSTIAKIGPSGRGRVDGLVVFFRAACTTAIAVAIVGEIPAGLPGLTFPDRFFRDSFIDAVGDRDHDRRLS